MIQQTLGYLWDLPASSTSTRGLGGGITWAWDPVLCDDLQPQFREDFFFIEYISCKDLKAAMHRAFMSWSANHAYISFVDVTTECGLDASAAARARRGRSARSRDLGHRPRAAAAAGVGGAGVAAAAAAVADLAAAAGAAAPRGVAPRREGEDYDLECADGTRDQRRRRRVLPGDGRPGGGDGAADGEGRLLVPVPASRTPASSTRRGGRTRSRRSRRTAPPSRSTQLCWCARRRRRPPAPPRALPRLADARPPHPPRVRYLDSTFCAPTPREHVDDPAMIEVYGRIGIFFSPRSSPSRAASSSLSRGRCAEGDSARFGAISSRLF